MYETLTRNSAATCRTGTPPSTAARTRKRRSFEYGIPSVRIKPRPQEITNFAQRESLADSAQSKTALGRGQNS